MGDLKRAVKSVSDIGRSVGRAVEKGVRQTGRAVGKGMKDFYSMYYGYQTGGVAGAAAAGSAQGYKTEGGDWDALMLDYEKRQKAAQEAGVAWSNKFKANDETAATNKAKREKDTKRKIADKRTRKLRNRSGTMFTSPQGVSGMQGGLKSKLGQ